MDTAERLKPRIAVKSRKPIIVPDVHWFPGRVACDPRLKSEIALPLFDRNGGSSFFSMLIARI